MIKQYVKKPIVISAIEFTGEVQNLSDVADFMKGPLCFENIKDGPSGKPLRCLVISTLEGDMLAKKGDYIIKGIQGEFYPCKPAIFRATYKEVEKNKRY